MISSEEFVKAIEDIGNHYETIKDLIYLHVDFNDTQDLINELSALRDTACIALRASHITKNFDQN